MRRLCAVFLLTVTAWLLVAPLALSESERSLLPACCRRAGAHHCAGTAMGMAERSADGAGASLHGEPCMLMPHSFYALLHHPGLAAGSSSLWFEGSAWRFFSTSALEGYAYAQARRAPRGPPSLLAHA